MIPALLILGGFVVLYLVVTLTRKKAKPQEQPKFPISDPNLGNGGAGDFGELVEEEVKPRPTRAPKSNK